MQRRGKRAEVHKTDIDPFIQTNCCSLVGLLKTINHFKKSTPETHARISPKDLKRPREYYVQV